MGDEVVSVLVLVVCVEHIRLHRLLSLVRI